ncbi:MAG: tetratricopeptide repeat protein [Kofleriaceae bacterium]
MRGALIFVVACGATPSSPTPPTVTTPADAAVASDRPVTIDAPPACGDAEECHHQAEDHEADGAFDLAAVAYGRACAFGDGASCFARGITLRGRVEPPDEAGSHAAFVKACEAGLADGCAQAGTDLITGIGVAEDVVKGRGMLERACAAGSGLSCYNLGVSARDGTFGATKSPTAAYALFEKGCAAGSGPACTEQAIALLDGSGVKRDAKRAAVLAEQACATSTAQCYLRAELLQKEKRHAEARSLYDKACGARSAAACHNLGVMLDKGLGGAKDPARAKASFARACSLGIADDCDR